jgi:hypothetical protein
MNKNKLLLILSILFSSLLFAQTSETPIDEKVGKYTIKVITNADSTYGYEIYEDTRLVEKQAKRPFFTFSSGFVHKQNALLIGKWHATELMEGRNNKYALSIPKARELGVSEDDLQFKNPNQN